MATEDTERIRKELTTLALDTASQGPYADDYHRWGPSHCDRLLAAVRATVERIIVLELCINELANERLVKQ